MAAVSKFERLVAHRPCGHLVHPWPGATCASEFLLMGRDGALGTTPYMLIFFLAKLAVGSAKGRALADEVRKLPFKMLRVSVLGATLASGIVGSICGFRWLFGRFRWWFVGLGPGSVAGLLSILTQDISDVRTFASYFYVAAVEYGVRKVIWRRNRLLALETLLFCAASAVLVRLQRLQKPTSLPWFFYPEACPASQAGAAHGEQCVVHGARGAARLAFFGAALTLLRIVVPMARDVLNRRPVARGRWLNAGWSFPAFLAAYVALQRWTRCLAAGLRHGADDGLSAAASGAVAGLSYLLHPSLSVLAAAVASTGQLLAQDKAPDGRWWPHLVFGLSTGWMLHARLNEPDHICPPFARLIFTECTRARADRIIDDYKNILQLNQKK